MRLIGSGLAVCLLAASTLSAEMPRKAAALEFRTHDGRQISLASLKGKAVAVMFFSTDCSHCQETTRLLGPIYDEYKAKGFEILGVAVNPTAITNLGDFVAAYNVKFPVGTGNSDQWSEVAEMSATAKRYVPHLLFVDRAGQVVEDHPGLDRKFWLDQENNIRATVERLTE